MQSLFCVELVCIDLCPCDLALTFNLILCVVDGVVDNDDNIHHDVYYQEGEKEDIIPIVMMYVSVDYWRMLNKGAI